MRRSVRNFNIVPWETPFPGHLNFLTFSLQFSGLPMVLMGNWTTKLNSRSRLMHNTFKNAYICRFWSPCRTSHSFTFKLLHLIMKKIATIERKPRDYSPIVQRSLKTWQTLPVHIPYPIQVMVKFPTLLTQVIVKCSGLARAAAEGGRGGGGVEISNWSSFDRSRTEYGGWVSRLESSVNIFRLKT